MLTINYPEEIYIEVVSIVECTDPQAKIWFLKAQNADGAEFLQTEEMTENGVAMTKYGAVIDPQIAQTPQGGYTIELLYYGKKYGIQGFDDQWGGVGDNEAAEPIE